ncbi:hypothetical protein [Streptomyces olivaceus]|uniref:hypothetical protein n=1 Tax=Streptomyces olivaceus TaxID=47716 RepID=UPI0022EEED9C|nr:hypothetical protein [Streptomyces olivaceus]GHI97180.1 hypothetical protein TPA0905_66510 [Streptomyces olivaceus]
MVRVNQTSNPRSIVVLSSGADWRTRAAGQRRVSGAEFSIPRRQPAKIKALRQTIGAARTAINAKRRHQARYALIRARALVNALPADLTARQREELSLLRKKFAARDTPAARATAKAQQSKPAAKKPKATGAVQKPKPAPVRELGQRYINRTALGYEPK